MTLENCLVNGFMYVVTGVFAGLLSGALGIGGGIVVVPALLAIFHYKSTITAEVAAHMASGTSLAIMIFTAQSSLRAHLNVLNHRHNAPSSFHLTRDHKKNWTTLSAWPVFKHLWPGMITGTLLGAILSHFFTADKLSDLLGVALILTAIHLWFTDILQITPRKHFPAAWVNFLVTLLIGIMSGILGLGGGILMFPYLMHCGIPLRKIPALSALCTLMVAIVGSVSWMLSGLHWPALPDYATGFVYWPAVFGVALPSMLLAPYGAKLTYVLPLKQLRSAFLLLLALTGIKLIF